MFQECTSDGAIRHRVVKAATEPEKEKYFSQEEVSEVKD